MLSWLETGEEDGLVEVCEECVVVRLVTPPAQELEMRRISQSVSVELRSQEQRLTAHITPRKSDLVQSQYWSEFTFQWY